MATGVELLENGRLLDARRAILTDEGVETMERLDRAIAEGLEASGLDRNKGHL